MNPAISTHTEYLFLWRFLFRNKKKGKLNKAKVKGATSKLLEVALEEKRREIIK